MILCKKKDKIRATIFTDFIRLIQYPPKEKKLIRIKSIIFPIYFVFFRNILYIKDETKTSKNLI